MHLFQHDAMKVRPFFVLLIFVLSVGVMVWIYYAATRPSDRTPADAARAETLRDLESCCRRKHVRAAQYEHFAGVASAEHRDAQARLFRAMALAERVHEGNCAEVMVRLGGAYAPPSRVILFRGTTDSNLSRAILQARQLLAEEAEESEVVRRTLRQGNRYAARMLAQAASGDRMQLLCMERCTADPELRYAVCPVCGALTQLTYRPVVCPFCLTDSKRFVLF